MQVFNKTGYQLETEFHLLVNLNNLPCVGYFFIKYLHIYIYVLV
jgi:hypothetical protein